ncbi:MAG: OB-fold putative lipoprotein [Bacteroidia bacterium]|nr:hypothetical protein [Bacteroidia bacterium]MCZ2278426.1 OB-fold putative lipoprotein [Bacteroidia bacterium]
MKKKIVAGLIILILLTAAGWYLYSLIMKPLSSLEAASPEVKVSADTLFARYNSDEATSDSLYLGKILLVSGIVKETDSVSDSIYTIYLESGDPSGLISCEMERGQVAALQHLKEGDSVVIKGRCNGFLMDVVLNQCLIQN